MDVTSSASASASKCVRGCSGFGVMRSSGSSAKRAPATGCGPDRCRVEVDLGRARRDERAEPAAEAAGAAGRGHAGAPRSAISRAAST